MPHKSETEETYPKPGIKAETGRARASCPCSWENQSAHTSSAGKAGSEMTAAL